MKDSSLGGKPTKPVVNVLPPGESTVTVQWSPPFFSTACDIAFGEDKNNLPKVGISSSGLWNIPKVDLVPERDYRIKVRGFNSFRNGDWSDPVVVRLPKMPVSQSAPKQAPQPPPVPVIPPVQPPLQPVAHSNAGMGQKLLLVLVLFLIVAMCLFFWHMENNQSHSSEASMATMVAMAAASANMATNNAHQALEAATDRINLPKALASMPSPAPTPVTVTVVINNPAPTIVLQPQTKYETTEKVIYVPAPPQEQWRQVAYYQPVPEYYGYNYSFDGPYQYSSYATYPSWSVNFGIGDRYHYSTVYSGIRMRGGFGGGFHGGGDSFHGHFGGHGRGR